ncbi:MAG: hypothetical protein PF505_14400 [Vallitaleaceae bacterium]|jgi:hypothetical protein|nr:hypothetical protein [Vallitaleaceae bacterium]
MKELIAKLVKDVDIDEATAKKVVIVVKDFLDDKLPGPISAQVNNALDGVGSDQIDGALDGVKGLFGKK